jgi:DcmR-like sensory protein
MDAAHTGHFHAVQFYKDDASLSNMVAGFLADGFAKNDPAVVIATPKHRAAIEADLRNRSLDVAGLKRLGDLVVLDARQTLATFMVDTMPHAATFQHVLGQTMRQLCSGRRNCVIHAYGEMVNVLWKDGLEAAAIRLETLWNELANTHEFKLLCGYSMGNFYKGAAIEKIKGQHSHVVEEAGEAATIN